MKNVADLPKGYLFGSFNINKIKSKFDEFKNLLVKRRFTFCAVCESKLCDSDVIDCSIPNYVHIRKERTRSGGGHILYINSSGSYEEIELPSITCGELEITALKVKLIGIKQQYVISVYKPPHVSIVQFLDYRSIRIKYNRSSTFFLIRRII